MNPTTFPALGTPFLLQTLGPHGEILSSLGLSILGQVPSAA
jgi:hypothetical protein